MASALPRRRRLLSTPSREGLVLRARRRGLRARQGGRRGASARGGPRGFVAWEQLWLWHGRWGWSRGSHFRISGVCMRCCYRPRSLPFKMFCGAVTGGAEKQWAWKQGARAKTAKAQRSVSTLYRIEFKKKREQKQDKRKMHLRERNRAGQTNSCRRGLHHF